MYVLMVTPNKFPHGDAGSIRDENFAKIYQELGYKVIHIGLNQQINCGEYRGIEFYSLYKNNNNFLKKIQNLILYKIRLKKIIKSIEIRYGKPQVYHIYDIPEAGIKLLTEKAKKYQIPIIHDSVEWYSPCEFKYGRFSYQYILKNRLNKVLIKHPISVIAISRYLEEYFLNKNLLTIRIPVIMDFKDYHPQNTKKDDNKIKLIYAGNPANKDYINECIIAFANLPNSIRNKFEFNLFGINDDYIEKCTNGEKISQIKAHGKVDRSIVIDYLSKSDFSLLLRPSDEVYTKAGFPTKLVEAMMNGCTMICNLTSDMDLYLKNNINSIIVEKCSVDALKDAFVKVAKLSNKQIEMLKRNARKTAIECFDYRLYKKDIDEFINKIKGEIDVKKYKKNFQNYQNKNKK